MSSNWMKFKSPAGHMVSIGACHRDPPDLAAPHYQSGRFQRDDLPPYVDLRSHLTPVEDQGHAGSCTANALAGAYEYLEKRTLDVDGRVSRLFVYWNERDLKGETDKDNGANLGLGIQSLQNAGACSEEIWPYDLENLFQQPPDEAFEAARDHTIDEAHKVKIDLHDMRHCLAEGYPFVFGLHLFDTFEADGHGGHGKIRLPDPRRSKSCGGHAMLCVGYSDKDKVFVVRNSWGTGWGDEGYCYIPFDYLADPRQSHDLWTLRRAHNLDFTEGVTKDEPSSFFEEDDPSVQVPADAPVGDDQPVDDPPAEDQPVDDPPAEEEQPVEDPPAEEEQPVDDPPAEEQPQGEGLAELEKDVEELGAALKELTGFLKR